MHAPAWVLGFRVQGLGFLKTHTDLTQGIRIFDLKAGDRASEARESANGGLQ